MYYLIILMNQIFYNTWIW